MYKLRKGVMFIRLCANCYERVSFFSFLKAIFFSEKYNCKSCGKKYENSLLSPKHSTSITLFFLMMFFAHVFILDYLQTYTDILVFLIILFLLVVLTYYSFFLRDFKRLKKK